MTSKRSSVRYEGHLSASFITFQKPCEEALRDLSEAYNQLADQIEEAWADVDRLDTALTRAMDRGNAYEEALEAIRRGDWNFGNAKPGLTVMEFAASSLDSREYDVPGAGQRGC